MMTLEAKQQFYLVGGGGSYLYMEVFIQSLQYYK